MITYDLTVTTADGTVYDYQVEAADAPAARWAAACRFVTGHRFETDGAVLSDAELAPALGPLCPNMELAGHCYDPSCHTIDATLPDLGECPKHGEQEITGGDSYAGFAGGRCWVLHLACGCSVVDEAGDIAAAY